MTVVQVLPKFSRRQLTALIGMLTLMALGSAAAAPPKPAPRGAQFQPETELSLEPIGTGAAAFNAQQALPTAMVSADFDVDGVKDLAVGYSLKKGGEIAILRGNLDAIAPQSKESWINAGQGRYAAAFLPQATMIPVPVEPDLLIAADVNGDGYIDLVFAAKNGNALYVLTGNGKGGFTLQQPLTVQGTITALAAYSLRSGNTSDALLVAVKTGKGYLADLYLNGAGRLALKAAYKMPGAVTAISTANLDSDLTPDAALIAGGQLMVLHGAGALRGAARIETLPVSDAVSLTTGSFLFDRHAGLQLAVLTHDGTVHFLAHEGFDPRPFTPEEIAAARRNAMRHEGGPTLAQIAGNTGDAPWTVVETLDGVAPAGFASTAPLLLRARAAGSGQDDVLAVNGGQREIALVRHPASANSALFAGSGIVTRSPLTSSDVVAAIAQRVSPLGADGVILLKAGSPLPQITTPAQSNTLYVNTPNDSLDANDTARCTQGSGESCSLRDAITYANADAGVNISGGTLDTIEIPAGAYNLNYQSGVVDGNGNAVTHLEVLGPMTLVGDTSGSGVTINGQNNDVVFSINPGAYGSYNPNEFSFVFSTTFENLTITGGQNNNNPASSSTGMANNVGGGINWDADGAGNLTLTNCILIGNLNAWGDGGGIWFYNSAGGGSGKLTLNGGTIANNSTSEIGGGIYQAYSPAGFMATNVAFTGNTASPSINTNDPGGASGADDGGGLFFSAIPSGSATTPSTISGGSITGNSADGDGGGVYTSQGITITGGTNISNNSATGSGGGIFHNADATTTVTGANITYNSATSTGGAITVGTETAANGNAFTISNSRFFGNGSTNGISGLSVGEPGSTGAGSATATENWWGCNTGPATTGDGCDQAVLYDPSTGSLTTSPNTVLTLGVSPNPVTAGSALQLDAAVNTDSSSGTVPGGPGPLKGLNIAFTATVGSFSASPSKIIDGTGNAITKVTPSKSGIGSATATLDNQTVNTAFTVNPGTATHLQIGVPASTVAGTQFNFTITALDANNNIATGYNGTVNLSTTDPSHQFFALPAFSNGTLTTQAVLDTKGGQTITATDASNSAIKGTSTSIYVMGASQTITFPTIPATTLITGTISLTATATSGLPVSFQSATPKTCSVSGSTATLLAIGGCAIAANQAGNGEYLAAAEVEHSFSVTLASQTINFAALPAKTYGAAPFTVSATATSGLPVSFISISASICTVSGSTVTLDAAGTCKIDATQGGNAYYSGAPAVTQSFVVNQAAQTITFPTIPTTPLLKGSVSLSATASSGLKVIFSSTTSSICKVSGSTATLVAVGECTIAANQAGNADYLPAPQVQKSFAITLTAQTITFGPLSAMTFGAAPFMVSATASSGLAVSFASTTASVCTVAGSKVTLVGAGTCTVEATQAGNTFYSAAPAVMQSFKVNKEAQTITFPTIPTTTLVTGSISLNATASSGLAVSYGAVTHVTCSVSGSTVTLLALGKCEIAATQAGNSNYLAAPAVEQIFSVTQASQTITFAPLSAKTYGATPFTVSATATSGLPVNFASINTSVCTVSGDTVTLVAPGTCSIKATQPGNADYSGAPIVTRSFTVNKETQSIAFASIPAQVVGADVTLSATASSGLPVSFASTTSSICTVSGNTATLIAAGTCAVKATQAGNADFSGAPAVTQSIAVKKTAQTIAFPTIPAQAVGANVTLAATASSGLPVTFESATHNSCSVSGNTATMLAAGKCAIAANQAGNVYYLAAPEVLQTFTVNAK